MARTSQNTPAEPVKTGEGEITVTFRSEHARLILYTGGKEPTARFENGQFSTNDPKIIAALRGHDQSREASRLYEEEETQGIASQRS